MISAAGVVRPPVLCDVQDDNERRYAQALQALCGFRQTHNVWPALRTGAPVLLFGWHDFYCEAIARFPGLCKILWTRSWIETDIVALSSRLEQALLHVRSDAAEILWTDVGDVPPPRASILPPIWPRAGATPDLAQFAAVGADGSLASMIAAIAAGSLIRLSKLLLEPPTSDLTPSVHERAEVLRGLLHQASHSFEDDRAIDLWIDLTPAAWSWRAFDALRRGTPVLASSSIAWASVLPDEIAEACVASPGTSTELVARMARHLLSDPDLRHRVLLAEIAALEALRAPFLARARETLHAVGFAQPHADPIARVG